MLRWPCSAAPALRRAASLPVACTEIDVTFSTDGDAPVPVVSLPRLLQPLRVSRSVPLARIRCPARLPQSASLPAAWPAVGADPRDLPVQLRAPVPVLAERGPRSAFASPVSCGGSAAVLPLCANASMPPLAPRRTATAPAPNQAHGAVMDDVLDDLLGSAVARLMAASEARPELARRAHSAPPAAMLDGCELWVEKWDSERRFDSRPGSLPGRPPRYRMA